ncbi:MAG TPA: radical SAM protein [Candidatus Omnitrophota bacterium]|nr:radical SAM protein [Candidatus Omnitrophota bacterium]
MPIVEPAIRPPSEAESFLLQVTAGCSSNDCTFCGAYFGKPFRVKPVDEIERDIRDGRRLYPETRRVFLMDGDALALNNRKLLPILESLNQSFPHLSRISSYANGYNITGRSLSELEALCAQKLSLIYMGLESGSQEVLDRCRKKATAEEMIEAVRRSAQAGIKSSVIVLLGLGGRKGSEMHVRETIKALNRMQPRYLSFLSVMLIPGTPLWGEAQRGAFQELNTNELLREMRDMIAGLELEKTIFRSNHASNYLPLEGRFPQDKGKLLAMLDSALSGKISLRSEWMRGL